MKYLSVKKTRTGLVLSPTEKVTGYAANAVDCWMVGVIQAYARTMVPAAFDSAQVDFGEVYARVQCYKQSLKTTARLVLDSLFLWMSQNETANFDHCMEAFAEFESIRALIDSQPVLPTKIKYSLKKHRSDPALSLLTLYGNPQEEIGDETFRICMNALKNAIKREKGRNVTILNPPDWNPVSPEYRSFQTFLVRDAFVRNVCDHHRAISEVETIFPLIRAVQSVFDSLAI